MANLFIVLPAPAGNGVGPATAVSTLGSPKSVLVGGTFVANVGIEVSADGGATFGPLFDCDGVCLECQEFAATHMRVRISGYASGAPVVAVGGQDLGELAGVLAVPAGNGLGAALPIGTLGRVKTVVVAGSFFGAVTIQVSEDGVVFAPFMYFTGPDQQTLVCTAQFMRVRRSGIPADSPVMTPIIAVAAANDAGAGGGAGTDRFAIPEQWEQQDIVGGQLAVPMETSVSQLFLDIPMVRAGSLTGLRVRLTAPIALVPPELGGPVLITVRASINGAPTALLVFMSTGSSGGGSVIAAGTVPFVAGDLIGVQITTSFVVSPAGLDVSAWLEATY